MTNDKAVAISHTHYENGPEGMPRVERMPHAVLECLIENSLFKYIAHCHAEDSEDRDRLHALMRDVAEEVLARVPAWPKAERAATQPAGDADAWLYTLKQPGKCEQWASVDANDTTRWPLAPGAVLTKQSLTLASAAPISEASAPAAVDVVTLLDEQKADVKARAGDWWRDYEAALHWIGQAVKEKQAEVSNEN